MAGKVYIVGAGPGDPGLLTLKGRRWLEEADVVVYDYLANPRLLDFAPPQAQRFLVGKHGGGKKVEQDVINRLLVDHARSGATVVRLKGGDPFVFGRGAEEMEVLRAAGIEYEIVPGVSAASAVPAYAGIPLTHRELASNVVITTGYEYPGKREAAVDWNELARSGSTLVIMMTSRQLGSNMQQLLDGGLAPDTPAAAIEWGTRADQRTITGTVATIGSLAAKENLRPPAIAVVGDVVRLRATLKWFERKPLFGRRIVITRPRQQAEDLARLLEDDGAEVIPFATIETVPAASIAQVDAAVKRAAEFDWMIFTSANGVRFFFERLRQIGADVRAWHRARVAAIGPQTARELERLGLHVDCVPDDYRAEGVIAALGRAGVKDKRILLPRAGGARQVLPRQLVELGAIVEEIVTYESVHPREDAGEIAALLAAGGIDALTFTSSSTVHNFAASLGEKAAELGRHAAIACIGPVTAATAREHGLKVDIQPEKYTVPDLATAITRYFAARPRRRQDRDAPGKETTDEHG
jgi:uroporphyrinogen III methyltransferase/synthase